MHLMPWPCMVIIFLVYIIHVCISVTHVLQYSQKFSLHKHFVQPCFPCILLYNFRPRIKDHYRLCDIMHFSNRMNLWFLFEVESHFLRWMKFVWSCLLNPFSRRTRIVSILHGPSSWMLPSKELWNWVTGLPSRGGLLYPWTFLSVCAHQSCYRQPLLLQWTRMMLWFACNTVYHIRG